MELKINYIRNYSNVFHLTVQIALIEKSVRKREDELEMLVGVAFEPFLPFAAPGQRM
jgi:hypothetical protein